MPDISNFHRVGKHSDEPESRRGFLEKAAFAAIAGGTLAACADDKAQKASRAGAAASPTPAPVPALSVAEATDKMHEAGVKAFPAKTAGKGGERTRMSSPLPRAITGRTCTTRTTIPRSRWDWDCSGLS